MFAVFQTLDWTTAAAAAVGGYLIGSIPFGLIFTRLAGAGDVRKVGSGNIGATNVLRTGSRWAALATLIGDAGKGALAVLIARHFGGDPLAVIAALAAFIGHIFPVWLGFRGGKGVATSLGIVLGLFWLGALIVLAIWVGVFAVTRLSSLSALIAAALSPVIMLLFHQPLFAVLTLLLALIILFTHRENIERLMQGTESRIGAKPKSGD
ncbi:MAG TPA: glycerol-3-phosphate 1-O-acyltransferase PlsY [Rhizomicrobium sp.]|jgi:glycerol-3-phosphate acyltransferase PlsY|nr:glycerol-3-phosphate 1-O-acyltransferase PlsY [Rhizomicrobium sp.]HEX4535202.1 glycerol-3-phosphate 1-O-acyltransferase PlsY [Rhizomicrobium sp.]